MMICFAYTVTYRYNGPASSENLPTIEAVLSSLKGFALFPILTITEICPQQITAVGPLTSVRAGVNCIFKSISLDRELRDQPLRVSKLLESEAEAEAEAETDKDARIKELTPENRALRQNAIDKKEGCSVNVFTYKNVHKIPHIRSFSLPWLFSFQLASCVGWNSQELFYFHVVICAFAKAATIINSHVVRYVEPDALGLRRFSCEQI